MKILIPDHVSQEHFRRFEKCAQDFEVLPLRILRTESFPRRVLRKFGVSCLSYSAYVHLCSMVAPQVSYSFFVNGSKLEAPIADAQVLLVTWEMESDCLRQLLLLLPGLKWIHSTKTGVDHLPEECLYDRQVMVTSSKGLHSRRIAEFVMGLIYCFSKQYLGHSGFQKERIWSQLPSIDVVGKRVGVLGTGSIGREVARLAKANGMQVLGISQRSQSDELFEEIYPSSQLHDFLNISDFIVICLPLTPQTARLLGAEEINCIRNNAYLINIARGQIVDEDALANALQQESLAGAALDVTDGAPLPRNHPYYSLPLKNLLLTHYCSYKGEMANMEIMERFEGNLKSFVAGAPLAGLVDPVMGY